MRSERAAEPTRGEVEAAAPANDCPQRRAQVRALLDEPAVVCTDDADCACYPAFIDCGGVTDSERAEKIRSLKTEGDDCGYQQLDGSSFNCAPWQCIPACNNGFCGRGTR